MLLCGKAPKMAWGRENLDKFGTRNSYQIRFQQARPGNDASGLCLCVYWLNMWHIWRYRWTDKWSDRIVKEDLNKKRLLIIRFSTGSHRGLNQPRNAVVTQVLRTDGPTDGLTDRPSYRYAFLSDASKNRHTTAPKKNAQKNVSSDRQQNKYFIFLTFFSREGRGIFVRKLPRMFPSVNEMEEKYLLFIL